jgi:hypothetical protein
MSTVFADVSAALDSRLNSFSGGDPVAWQNTQFTPANGTLYLRPSVLPADTEQIGMGTTGLDEHAGVYQIDIFAMAGDGRGAAEVKADAVADHFKRGTDLLYNGVYVRLGNVSRNQGIVNGDRFVISLSINYTAHTAPR